MNKAAITTKFDYAQKGCIEACSDFALGPLRYALNGRTVRCLDKNTWDKAGRCHQDSIEFITSRKGEGLFHAVRRICALSIAILLFPLTIAGIVGKACSHSKELAARYIENRVGDRKTYEHRISKGQVRKFLMLISKPIHHYSSLKRAAHILADKEMGKDGPFAHLENGFNHTSARVLREELEKYRTIADFGDAENAALKAAREYERWARGMLISTYPDSRDVSLDLKDRLCSMEPGETFLIPMSIGAAWQSGHLTTIGFHKNDDSSYSLTVYNCGLGLNNHPTINGKILPFKIENIDQGHITDLEFLRRFFSFTSRKNSPGYSSFYKFLRDHPWNEEAVVNIHSYPISPLTALQARRAMRSGSCIWRSPLAALKGIMPFSNYKQFVYAMKVNETEKVARKAKRRNSKERKLAEIGLEKCGAWRSSKLGAPLPTRLQSHLDDRLAFIHHHLQ